MQLPISFMERYLHQHVFRTALNGSWGEETTVKEGEHSVTGSYTLKVPAEWKINDLAIVGNKILAATNEGLMYSSDKGHTWATAIEGKAVAVSVNNKGPKISPQDLARLTERFYRLQELY